MSRSPEEEPQSTNKPTILEEKYPGSVLGERYNLDSLLEMGESTKRQAGRESVLKGLREKAAREDGYDIFD